MDLEDLDLSAIVPQKETDAERQKRLYSRPPERYIIDHFTIGDQLRFVQTKTATQCKFGIIVGIQDYYGLLVLMLGNIEPGTTSVFTFPEDFYYLDRIEPSHELVLDGDRKLDGMHVCVQLSDDRRVLGYITNRRLCFLGLG